MQYMLLIIEGQGDRDARSPEHGRALYQSMVEFGERLRSTGVLIATNSLRELSVRLHKTNGRAKVVDGPFTESKELVGGYFLLECDTREEALGFAGECPAADWATVEVREVGPCYE
jgi:hypothetical protein